MILIHSGAAARRPRISIGVPVGSASEFEKIPVAVFMLIKTAPEAALLEVPEHLFNVKPDGIRCQHTMVGWQFSVDVPGFIVSAIQLGTQPKLGDCFGNTLGRTYATDSRLPGASGSASICLCPRLKGASGF